MVRRRFSDHSGKTIGGGGPTSTVVPLLLVPLVPLLLPLVPSPLLLDELAPLDPPEVPSSPAVGFDPRASIPHAPASALARTIAVKMHPALAIPPDHISAQVTQIGAPPWRDCHVLIRDFPWNDS